MNSHYRASARNIDMQNVLSRTVARPDRTAKQEQKKISPKHATTIFSGSVHGQLDPRGDIQAT